MSARWIGFARPLLITLLGLGLTACAAARAPVGLQQRLWHDPSRPGWDETGQRSLALTLWYPAAEGSVEQALSVGPFEALAVAPEARLAGQPQRLPLLLLSHGTGGSAMSLGWLARGLAAQGYLVVGLDHEGNSAARPPYRLEAFVTPWQRPRDLSVAMDQLLRDSDWGPRIDAERIGAIGFSLGGYTVLAALGARFSAERLAAFWSQCLEGGDCAVPPELERLRAGRSIAAMLDEVPGLQQRLLDGREGAADLREPRIKAALVMAPVLGRWLEPASVATIARPLQLIAASLDDQAPAAGTAAPVARLAQHARLEELPGYGHYAFMATCRAELRQALAEVCVDQAGHPREALHRQVLELAQRFFAAQLKPSRRP